MPNTQTLVKIYNTWRLDGSWYTIFFFNVGPPKEDIFFWPPSVIYISINSAHIFLQITFLCGPLRAASLFILITHVCGTFLQTADILSFLLIQKDFSTLYHNVPKRDSNQCLQSPFYLNLNDAFTDQATTVGWVGILLLYTSSD